MIFEILVENRKIGGWRDLLNVFLQGYCRRTGRRRDRSGGQSERGLQVFFLTIWPQTINAPKYLIIVQKSWCTLQANVWPGWCWRFRKPRQVKTLSVFHFFVLLCACFVCLSFPIVSSDRSSYSDGVLVEIRNTLFEILSIAVNICNFW